MARWAAGALTNAYLTFGGVNLSNSVREVVIEERQALIDASALNDAHHLYLQGRTDSTIQLEVFFETTSPDPGSVLYAGAAGTLVFGPRGTATGMPKYEAPVVVQAIGETFSRETATLLRATLKLTAPWTSHYNQGGVW